MECLLSQVVNASTNWRHGEAVKRCLAALCGSELFFQHCRSDYTTLGFGHCAGLRWLSRLHPAGHVAHEGLDGVVPPVSNEVCGEIWVVLSYGLKDRRYDGPDGRQVLIGNRSVVCDLVSRLGELRQILSQACGIDYAPVVHEKSFTTDGAHELWQHREVEQCSIVVFVLSFAPCLLAKVFDQSARMNGRRVLVAVFEAPVVVQEVS